MKKLALILLTGLFSQICLAQSDYYWVGNSGNWSDFANHWATTSGGSTFHSSAPTSQDIVYFDANSFSSSSQTVTLDVDGACHDMEWTGVVNNPTFEASFGNDLEIHGSLYFVDDATYSLRTIIFKSSSAESVDPAGVTMGTSSGFTFNGTGTWTFTDDAIVSRMDFDNGTVNFNGQSITASSNFFIGGSGGSLTLNLGASFFDLGKWDSNNSSTYTLNSGTSTIRLDGGCCSTDRFEGDGETFYNLELANTTRVTGSNTFNKITVEAGATVEFGAGDTQTFTEFIADGIGTNYINLQSSSGGSQATLSQSTGSVNLIYVRIKDLVATGGATFSATDSYDDGNNSGWSITEPTGEDYFWVGNSGDWSDYANHWATTSGGSTFHTESPISLDNVYFDANSFDAPNHTVTLDLDAGLHDMDWTGVTNAPSFTATSGNDLEVYGSFILEGTVDYEFRTIYFKSTDSGETINTGGVSSGSQASFEFDGTGDWTFNSEVIVRRMDFTNGTINFNDQNVTISNNIFVSGSGGALTMNLGASTVALSSWDSNNSSSYTFNSGTSTLVIDGGCCGTGRLEGDGETFHNLELANSAEITGSNSFNRITIDAGSVIEFGSGDTQTFVEFEADGASDDLITIKSTTAGVQATLSQSTGSVDVSNIRVQDLVGTGGATFNATSAFDDGNNSNWTISAPSGQTYYWVDGSGDWSDLNHWATASGGSTFHSDVPGQLDDLIFDANSFSANDQEVRMDVQGTAHDVDFTGVSHQVTVKSSGQNQINMYGSLAGSDSVAFNNITFACYSEDSETISMGSDIESRKSQRTDFNFLGDGGDWTVLDHITTTGFIYVNCNATLNMNGKDLYMKNFSNSCSSGSSGTMLTGDDMTITFGAWDAKRTNPLTLTTGTNVSFVQNHFDNQQVNNQFKGGGLTYPNLTIENTEKEVRLFDNNTIQDLTITAGTTVEFSDTQTITSLTANGNKNSFITLRSVNDGIQATLSASSGNIVLSYVDLKDLNATGGASYTANQSVNNGNNSGWTINPLTGEDYYWIGNGGSWSDLNHWATTSGGSTNHTFLPGILDNVFFDDNSFDENEIEIEIDVDAECSNLDMSLVDQSVELNSGNPAFDIFGSVYLNEDVLINIIGSGGFNLRSATIDSITVNGGKIRSLYFRGSGLYKVKDTLHVDEFYVDDGSSVDLDGQFLTVDEFTIQSGVSSFDATDAKIVTRAFDSFAPGSALNYTNSCINIQLIDKVVQGGGSPDVELRLHNRQNFNLDDLPNYGIVEFPEGQIDYYGESQMEELIIEEGVEVVLSSVVSSNPLIEFDDLTAIGSANEHIILRSETLGQRHSLTSLSGNSVEVEWVELQDSEAAGASFSADNSFDNGNNSGWTISAPPNAPSTPSNPTTDQFTSSSFVVSWDSAENALEYRLDVDDANDFFSPIIDNLMVSDTSYQVQNLNTGRAYYWRVRSVGVSGTSGNTLVQEVITIPSAPTALDAQSVLTTQFTANWSTPVGASSYQLDVSTDNLFTAVLNDYDAISVDGDQYVVDGLSPGTQYYYRVRAVNASGVSDNSNVISVSASDKQDQVITFDELDDRTFGDASFGLSATSSSGLLVTFQSSDESIASVDGTSLTILSAGQVEITASQAGNDEYNAAESISRTLVIIKAGQEITFDPDPIPDRSLSDGDFAISVESSSGIELMVEIDGPATIDSTNGNSYQLSLAGESGIVTLTASNDGNANYNDVIATRTFNVVDDLKDNQQITFDSIPDATYGDSLILLATASSSLEVEFRVVTGPAVLVNDKLVFTGIGDVTIEVLQSGNEEFNPAETVSRSFEVLPALLTIEVVDTMRFYNEDNPEFRLEITGWVYDDDISDITLPEIVTSALNSSNVGIYDLVLTGGSADNYDISNVNGELTINKAPSQIIFEAIPDKVFGDPEFEPTVSSTAELTVNLESSNQSVATIEDNIVTIVGAGTTIVTATQLGSQNYEAADSVQNELTILKASQEIEFGSIDDVDLGVDEPIVLLSATASSGLEIVFELVSGPADLDSNTLRLTGAGTVVVRAIQSGDQNYEPASAIEQSFEVAGTFRLEQTITFESVPAVIFGVEPIELNATSSSGLPVTFTVDSGPATLNGVILTVTGAGEISIIASQGGNAEFFAAEDVVQTIHVARANQQITFEEIDDVNISSTTEFLLSATSSSGLDVVFSILSGPAELEDKMIILNGEGAVRVEATQPGDQNYNPAAAVTRSFEVFSSELSEQTIGFEDIGSKTFGDQPFELVATASSGLTVNFESSDESILSITGSMATINGAGQVSITASQPGNDAFLTAEPVVQIVDIQKAVQEITLAPIPNFTLGINIPFEIIATTTSGLEISFEISGPAGIIDGLLTPEDTGLVEVTALQPGNDNYLEAASVSTSFRVILETLGFEDQDRIVLYPNPAANYIRFEPRNAEAMIFNAFGQSVWSGNLKDGEIDISSLRSGFYFLQVGTSAQKFLKE